MPELAEVELVRRGLERLVDDDLASAELRDPKLTVDLSSVLDTPLIGLRRHGKLLGLDFGEQTLAVHLRMTGSLQFGEHPKARAVLRFVGDEGDQALSFVDARRFGTLTLGPSASFGNGLGPDLLTLDDDATARTHARWGRSLRPIKGVLLDQRVVAGIGNYMADEALWVAQIHPESPLADLPIDRWRAALLAAVMVAYQALAAGGVSMRDYVGTEGQAGEMQTLLRCYGRSGQPCLRCGTPLAKIVVAGRGSTYCPHCQHRS